MSKKFIIILCIVSLGGFLFGFDMAVIAGALPLVKQFFGLSPAQEGIFVSSALLGCIIGVFFTGPLTDKYGRKPAFVTAALLFLFSAIGCGFSSSYSILIASRSIGGLGVGIASIVVPLYLAEISPSKFRGRSVTCYQLAITFGILFAYISNYLILEYSSAQQNELWRNMFLVGAIPALLLCIGVYFIPESPRWLSKNGRNTEVATISATLGLSDIQEVGNVSSKGNLRDLFSPIYRKAFLLGLFLPLFSQLSGINAIVYYGPSILLESGISLNNSYHAQLFFGAANVLFTFFAIWKVDNWGRRPLYLLGTVGATLSLLVTGYLFNQGQVNNIALIIAILSFLFFFAFSIGPLKFVVAAEIFPNAIRARAMGISIMVMWISDAIVGQLTPILLASWGARYTFWLFAFFCAIAFLVVLGFLPETKGKPLEEIEKFWIEKHNKKSTNK